MGRMWRKKIFKHHCEDTKEFGHYQKDYKKFWKNALNSKHYLIQKSHFHIFIPENLNEIYVFLFTLLLFTIEKMMKHHKYPLTFVL